MLAAQMGIVRAHFAQAVGVGIERNEPADAASGHGFRYLGLAQMARSHCRPPPVRRLLSNAVNEFRDVPAPENHGPTGSSGGSECDESFARFLTPALLLPRP